MRTVVCVVDSGGSVHVESLRVVHLVTVLVDQMLIEVFDSAEAHAVQAFKS